MLLYENADRFPSLPLPYFIHPVYNAQKNVPDGLSYDVICGVVRMGWRLVDCRSVAARDRERKKKKNKRRRRALDKLRLRNYEEPLFPDYTHETAEPISREATRRRLRRDGGYHDDDAEPDRDFSLRETFDLVCRGDRKYRRS